MNVNLSRLKCLNPEVLKGIITGKELINPKNHLLLQFDEEYFSDLVIETYAPDSNPDQTFHEETIALSKQFPDDLIYAIYTLQADLFKRAFVTEYKEGKHKIAKELFDPDGLFLNSVDIRPQNYQSPLN